MSETPRTDSIVHNVAELGVHARQLERELAAANRKIQRLIEAGDELATRIGCGCDFTGCGNCRLREEEWTAAKEEIQ